MYLVVEDNKGVEDSVGHLRYRCVVLAIALH